MKITLSMLIFLGIIVAILFTTKKEAGIIAPIFFNQEPKCLGYLWYKYDKERDLSITGSSIGKIYCVGILLQKQQ
jgi:hypothetical protein